MTMGDKGCAGGRVTANCLQHPGQQCEVFALSVASLAASEPQPPRVDLTDSLESIDSSSQRSDSNVGEDTVKREFMLVRLHGRCC